MQPVKAYVMARNKYNLQTQSEEAVSSGTTLFAFWRHYSMLETLSLSFSVFKSNELRHEKNGFLYMRKQSRKSAVQ